MDFQRLGAAPCPLARGASDTGLAVESRTKADVHDSRQTPLPQNRLDRIDRLAAGTSFLPCRQRQVHGRESQPRPMPRPATTLPWMRYRLPSRTAAWRTAPSRSRSRIRVLFTTAPWYWNSGSTTTSNRYCCAAPSAFRHRRRGRCRTGGHSPRPSGSGSKAAESSVPERPRPGSPAASRRTGAGRQNPVPVLPAARASRPAA